MSHDKADLYRETFEAEFGEVSEVVGFKQDDGRVDTSRAPDGSRYQVVTSGGVRSLQHPVAAWFMDQGPAGLEWLRHASDAFDKRRGTLYWKRKPQWIEAEFVGINQAAMIQDASLAGCIALRIGFFEAEFAIAKEREE